MGSASGLTIIEPTVPANDTSALRILREKESIISVAKDDFTSQRNWGDDAMAMRWPWLTPQTQRAVYLLNQSALVFL